MFFDCFNVLMLKIIFKNKKYIILMYFRAKNTLKINCYHTAKQTLQYKVQERFMRYLRV